MAVGSLLIGADSVYKSIENGSSGEVRFYERLLYDSTAIRK
jgi:hypothetical protein